MESDHISLLFFFPQNCLYGNDVIRKHCCEFCSFEDVVHEFILWSVNKSCLISFRDQNENIFGQHHGNFLTRILQLVFFLNHSLYFVFAQPLESSKQDFTSNVRTFLSVFWTHTFSLGFP